MPTTVTPAAASQSRRANRPLVVVVNVRVCCWRCPSWPGVRTQAATVFLWTSSPAQRSMSLSIPLLLLDGEVIARPGGASM
jgi:hypothetical protein